MEQLLRIWQYVPLTNSFEVQDICKEVAETALAKKCPCCNGEILCSEEVLSLLGECPNCYQDDLLYEQYCDYIEDLDALEHF